MKSQPFQQSSTSTFAYGGGIHKGRRHVMRADSTTVTKTITTDPFISTIDPENPDNPAVTPIIPNTTISDPKLEVNFAALSCDEIKMLIDYLNNKTASAKLTGPAASYYSNKLTLLTLALKTCNAGTGGTMPPGNNPSGTVLLPVIPLNIPTSLAPSSGNPASGSGSGAGGGDTSAKTKKPFPWWAVIALGLLIFSGYETNKAA